MSIVSPVVRHLIICEDVQTDPANPHRVTIVGLLTTIRSMDYPPFPLLYREFCVFVQLTECRGGADVRTEILHADTGRRVARTKTRRVRFAIEPLEVHAIVFRIRDCPFREAGVYLAQLWYNDVAIAEHPLMLR